MRSTLVLSLLLVACETTESSGKPFSPVAIETPSAASDEGGVDAVPSDERFDIYDGLTTISSEELAGGVAPADPDVGSAEGEDGAVVDAAGQDEVLEAAPAGSSGSAGPEPAAAPTGSAGAGTVPLSTLGGAGATGFAPAAAMGVSGWPLRVVGITPDAQPPRAILGLPDGQEVVVRPGSMVPGAGVVVMSVGSDGVQVARIVPAGDHAQVHSETLTAQF